jgi:hypothetical protein
MTLEYIEFVFENCESFRISGRYVGDFVCSGIGTSVKRIAVNSISLINTCDFFAIEISKEGDERFYDSFGEESICSKFAKLKYWNDIVSIEFKLDDNSFQYYVPWEDEYPGARINLLQTAMISDCGNLYIIITGDEKKRNFFKIFGKSINNKRDIKFKFRMMDVPYLDEEDKG